MSGGATSIGPGLASSGGRIGTETAWASAGAGGAGADAGGPGASGAGGAGADAGGPGAGGGADDGIAEVGVLPGVATRAGDATLANPRDHRLAET